MRKGGRAELWDRVGSGARCMILRWRRGLRKCSLPLEPAFTTSRTVMIDSLVMIEQWTPRDEKSVIQVTAFSQLENSLGMAKLPCFFPQEGVYLDQMPNTCLLSTFEDDNYKLTNTPKHVYEMSDSSIAGTFKLQEHEIEIRQWENFHFTLSFYHHPSLSPTVGLSLCPLHSATRVRMLDK